MLRHIVSIIIALCCCASAGAYNLPSSDNTLNRQERLACDSPELSDSILGEASLCDSIPRPPHTYGCLVNICLAKAILHLKANETDKGREMLRQAITMDILDGNKQHASEDFDYLESIAKCQDSIAISMLAQSLSETLRARLSRHTPSQQATIEQRVYASEHYVTLLLVTLILAVSLLVYTLKADKDSEHMSAYQSTLHRLNDDAERYQAQMEKLKDKAVYYEMQLAKLRDNTNERLGKGERIMNHIMNGGLIKNISIEDEQCFVDYYAFKYPDSYANITQGYKSLSLRHTTYLILSTLGFSDPDIQKILFVKDSTIRNYRARMKKKMK